MDNENSFRRQLTARAVRADDVAADDLLALQVQHIVLEVERSFGHDAEGLHRCGRHQLDIELAARRRFAVRIVKRDRHRDEGEDHRQKQRADRLEPVRTEQAARQAAAVPKRAALQRALHGQRWEQQAGEKRQVFGRRGEKRAAGRERAAAEQRNVRTRGRKAQVLRGRKPPQKSSQALCRRKFSTRDGVSRESASPNAPAESANRTLYTVIPVRAKYEKTASKYRTDASGNKSAVTETRSATGAA